VPAAPPPFGDALISGMDMGSHLLFTNIRKRLFISCAANPRFLTSQIKGI
jgi:hypothetical protein